LPFGRCEIAQEGRTILQLRSGETEAARDDAMPELRILELQRTHDPLMPLHRGNPLGVSLDGVSDECTTHDPGELLRQLNGFLARHDPELMLTEHGHTAMFPQLLRLARRLRLPWALDREPTPVVRRLVTEGRSFFTYGQMRYHRRTIRSPGGGTSTAPIRFCPRKPASTALWSWRDWPSCRCSAWPGPPSPRS
jgi:hypothetical protein